MGSYRLYLLPIFLSILLTSCECPDRVDSRYADGLTKRPGNDTIASSDNPALDIGLEVSNKTIKQEPRKNGLPCKRNLILGIDMKTWYIADSTRITCDKDLPGIKAGLPISNSLNTFIQLQADPAWKQALEYCRFRAHWNAAEWNSLPDSATLTFTFLTNQSEKLNIRQKVYFSN